MSPSSNDEVLAYEFKSRKGQFIRVTFYERFVCEDCSKKLEVVKE